MRATTRRNSVNQGNLTPDDDDEEEEEEVVAVPLDVLISTIDLANSPSCTVIISATTSDDECDAV